MHADAAAKPDRLSSLRATAREEARREIARAGEAATAAGATGSLITAAQLAELWQLPVRTVYAWAKRNAIPHYRAGRLLRFDPIEVEEHFRAHGYAGEVPGDPEHPGESAFALLSA